MQLKAYLLQSKADILSQLRDNDTWSFDQGCNRNTFLLQDRDFNCAATVEIFSQYDNWDLDGSYGPITGLNITTAMSGYTYRIHFTSGFTILEYEGAYNGFLQQNLMLNLVPMEQGLTLRSSIYGEISPTDYVIRAQERMDFIIRQKQDMGMDPYPVRISAIKTATTPAVDHTAEINWTKMGSSTQVWIPFLDIFNLPETEGQDLSTFTFNWSQCGQLVYIGDNKSPSKKNTYRICRRKAHSI